MTSFAGRVARQQDAVFRTLGEDAVWGNLADPVRVRFREADETARFGEGSVIGTSRVLYVRRSEVEAPAEGDICTLVASGRRLRIVADPKLDKKGRWACVVRDAP